MTNSRAKGVNGELEAVHLFKRWFPDARRGARQSGGGSEGADVIGVPFWVEVKRRKRVISLTTWANGWTQANRDMRLAVERGILPGYQSPIVIARCDGDKYGWYVLCHIEVLQGYGFKGKATPVVDDKRFSREDKVFIVSWLDFAAMLDKHYSQQQELA